MSECAVFWIPFMLGRKFQVDTKSKSEFKTDAKTTGFCAAFEERMKNFRSEIGRKVCENPKIEKRNSATEMLLAITRGSKGKTNENLDELLPEENNEQTQNKNFKFFNKNLTQLCKKEHPEDYFEHLSWLLAEMNANQIVFLSVKGVENFAKGLASHFTTLLLKKSDKELNQDDIDEWFHQGEMVKCVKKISIEAQLGRTFTLEELTQGISTKTDRIQRTKKLSDKMESFNFLKTKTKGKIPKIPESSDLPPHLN